MVHQIFHQLERFSANITTIVVIFLKNHVVFIHDARSYITAPFEKKIAGKFESENHIATEHDVFVHTELILCGSSI